MKKHLIAAALVLAASSSLAQVHKCKDASGKIVYSDAPCASSATGGRINVRPNTIDTSMDWERNKRNIQQRQLEGDQRRPVPAAQPSPAMQTNQQHASYACKLAIRNAETQSQNASPAKIDSDRGEARRACGFDPWPGPSASEIDAANKRSAALDKAARAKLAASDDGHPALMTSCDAGGCWDTRGNRYNSSAGGNFIRQDGRPCTKTGSLLNCN